MLNENEILSFPISSCFFVIISCIFYFFKDFPRVAPNTSP